METEKAANGRRREREVNGERQKSTNVTEVVAGKIACVCMCVCVCLCMHSCTCWTEYQKPHSASKVYFTGPGRVEL